MRNILKFFFQFLNIFQIHVLDHDHGKCSHPVFIHQNILTFYCLQMLWKITEQIIIYSRLCHSDH